MHKAFLLFLAIYWSLALTGWGYANERSRETIRLSPADQLILERIDKLNERLTTEIGKVNERIDKLNDRIDLIWATMIGGFLGVMIFVGGLVFWDRRTTLAPVHTRIDELTHREKVLVDTLKEFAKDEPKLMEYLRISGLL
ncbi:MAG: hypothetical protein SVZ03_06185 [Spirochaetota bacterium]|nr:hypothetical protein [Spirochaetota bacterium]